MLTIYRLDHDRLLRLKAHQTTETLSNHWLELVRPSREEMAFAQSLCSEPLPSLRDIEELESSSFHVSLIDGFQVNSLFFYRPDGVPTNLNTAFILKDGGLISISSHELPHIRLLRRRNRNRVTPLPDALAILMALMDIKVDGLADEIEQAYRDLEEISRKVMGRRHADLESAIDGLAEQEDLVGKVRLGLMDVQRDMRFILRQPMVNKKYRKQGNAVLADIATILPHNDFLSDKADFLLNATQGFIDMEQNRILKIFSVTALVFLPPTLIAGIYGMNFQHMPELAWPWGYPLALLLMFIAGSGPFIYFKRKGWL
ncbi:MAG: magnesium/cobalt transporter CorA [Gammaproteobacteria bacterium SHHR-1]|uniref:magnesium/cobalt transporter CorA n=1 Tax=Magnetovirga frankeli TaxID=947516 RepID=UPI001293E965|nr:magnesium/cobalt transporter CorA [gamma proteobacterium SS-5]